jgi:hypothetical protein
MSKKPLTTYEFITRSKKKYGDKFSYEDTIYVNQKTKLKLKCNIHGEFETYPSNHLVGMGSCPKCRKIQNGLTHKKDTSFFIKKAKKIFGNRYDYSITKYEHSLKKVDIICKKHGIFKIKPSNHINNKQGCSFCGIEATSQASRKGLDSFLDEIRSKPNFDKYDFSNISCFNNRNHSKIKCVCKKHGEYNTTPRNVIRSNFFGCKKCKTEDDRYDTSKFIEISKKTHNDYYVYDKVEYIKAHDDVVITCPKHGDFICKPYIHMAGGGFCPKCTSYVSSFENEISDFLNKIKIPNIKTSVRNIKGIKEIDILSEEHKIGIEFNGLYWHSDIFKNKKYHLEKTEKMKELGYRLIHIFEDEWVEKRSICESFLRNAFNKTSKKIYARKCSIKEVSFLEAKQFLNFNHMQGNCMSKYRYGLYFDNELISLMTFGKTRTCLGSKKAAKDEYELLRFCNKNNTIVVGGASRLFNFFVKIKNPQKIISFCDKRYGTGKLYKKLNFNFLYDTNVNYFYIKHGRRYNRFSFRKDVLVNKGHDKNKTEKDIMKELGYNRIYDCGSMKFEWEYRKF